MEAAHADCRCAFFGRNCDRRIHELGAIPAFLAYCLHVLAGAHARLSYAVDAAIHQWRKLGTDRTQVLGSSYAQPVADAGLLDSHCRWNVDEQALSMDNYGCESDGRSQGRLLSESNLLYRPRDYLFYRVGFPGVADATLVAG